MPVLAPRHLNYVPKAGGRWHWHARLGAAVLPMLPFKPTGTMFFVKLFALILGTVVIDLRIEQPCAGRLHIRKEVITCVASVAFFIISSITKLET